MRAMIERVRSAEHAQVWEQTATLDLLTHEGVCRGAIVWNAQHGKTLVWAKQTILCTGGAGRLYRETTNPDIATADGHALALCIIHSKREDKPLTASRQDDLNLVDWRVKGYGFVVIGWQDPTQLRAIAEASRVRSRADPLPFP